jgi:hypothetical protein
MDKRNSLTIIMRSKQYRRHSQLSRTSERSRSQTMNPSILRKVRERTRFVIFIGLISEGFYLGERLDLRLYLLGLLDFFGG